MGWVGQRVQVVKPPPGFPFKRTGTVVEEHHGGLLVEHDRSFWEWLLRRPARRFGWGYYEVDYIP